MRNTALKSLMILALIAPVSACAHKLKSTQASNNDVNVVKTKNVTKARVKPGGASIGVNGFLWRATPVSYTHLDVYKRQIFCFRLHFFRKAQAQKQGHWGQ